jgi:hypothetical protein
MDENYPIKRSGNFLLYYQAEGLCQALRLTMQTRQDPGPTMIAFLKTLRDCALKVGTGEPFERLPKINDNSPITDLLVAAEVIRTTMLAFLTPEEMEEQKRVFGFRPSS